MQAIWFIRSLWDRGIFVCEKDKSVDNSRDYYYRSIELNRENSHFPSRKTEHRFFKSTMKGERHTSSIVGGSILYYRGKLILKSIQRL